MRFFPCIPRTQKNVCKKLPPTNGSHNPKAMAMSNEDSFTERFALHLAVGLLGSGAVVEYLNEFERKEQPAAPLYWRSNPMITGASRMLYQSNGTTDSTSEVSPNTKILLFDATFTFVKNLDHGTAKQNPTTAVRILVSFGFFLLRQIASGDQRGAKFESGNYISTQPLNYEQILSYMNSLQLDRDSVSPEKLADSMAEEFLRQGSPSDTTEPKETASALKSDQEANDPNYILTVDYDISREEGIKQEDDGCSSIGVNVPCKTMGDSNGKLLLEYMSSEVAKFDVPALRFLSWDFSKNRHFASKEAEMLLSNKDLVDKAFERWQMQASVSVSNNEKNLGDQNNIGPTESTTNGNNGSTTNNDKPKKRKRTKGMGILPSARRKRNKGLVYDSK